jgi:alpha-ribazole phosphatase
MQAIYLIRHTTPAVNRGICYGQTDLDVTESFYTEASAIREFLPQQIRQVYSSPLMRCKKLAEHLFPGREIKFEKELMEIHCGQWEMKKWDELPTTEVDPWMKDFVSLPIPGGESYLGLHERVTRCFEWIADSGSDVAIVTHGGVIRSILTGITQTPLADSFKAFSLNYGCVVRITSSADCFQYEIISNIVPAEKEIHKPNRFTGNR